MAQNPLPGMEDRKIADLQAKAVEYAEVRDERQKLTTQEVELKGELLKLMKKHKRDHYEFEGVSIDIVTEEETVKLKVRKPQEDEEI